jgi:ubiquinone/menaquinone biosynthesis C-methylase UbiE
VTDSAGTPTWSDIASWYDELIRSGSGPHDTALSATMRLVGDVRGLTVLDLACGQGLASRALAGAGAGRVIGIDSSQAMLELARNHGGPPQLEYARDDAERLRAVPDASIDVATCQLGLMDIPDLAATLAAVHRVLRPDGRFVLVIGHPCFLAPDAETIERSDGRLGRWIGDYLTERFWRSTNPQGVRRAGNHHRTLATYLNALVDAGFLLERVEEPTATELLAAQQPEYRSLPIFLAIRARASAGIP